MCRSLLLRSENERNGTHLDEQGDGPRGPQARRTEHQSYVLKRPRLIETTAACLSSKMQPPRERSESKTL